MYQTRKIGVVGQGHVGAHVANSLLMQGIADELYLCDINEAKVTSEVQDLRDSLSFVPYNTKIVNCYDHYEELACCDVIVNAAGKVALAASNRDGELFFTTDAARTFAKRIVDAGFDGIFVSISNPCDVPGSGTRVLQVSAAQLRVSERKQVTLPDSVLRGGSNGGQSG